MSIQKPSNCKKNSADFSLLNSRKVLFQKHPLISSQKCGRGDAVIPFAIKGKNLMISNGVLQGKICFVSYEDTFYFL
jgi:hypothetical protein